MKMEGDALTKRILEANPTFHVSVKIGEEWETKHFDGPEAAKESLAYQQEMSAKGYSSQNTVSATLRMSVPYAFIPAKRAGEAQKLGLHQKR